VVVSQTDAQLATLLETFTSTLGISLDDTGGLGLVLASTLALELTAPSNGVWMVTAANLAGLPTPAAGQTPSFGLTQDGNLYFYPTGGPWVNLTPAASSIPLNEFAAPNGAVAMGTENFVNLAAAISSGQVPTIGQLAGNQYAYVVSGCVWTADSPGSTLNASMTAGTIMVKGILLTVASVTARGFTANDDTYVDLQDNGDGTAKFVYTAVVGNATPATLGGASQTPYNTLRLAVITAGASSIPAAGINQGAPNFGGTAYSGNAGANTLHTTTVAAGSNGNNITTATLGVAANSLTAAGFAAVDTTAGTVATGFGALIAYTSGGGTTTLSGITVLSGSGTVATGGNVAQISLGGVSDMSGNLICPGTPNPKTIAMRSLLGSAATTSTSSVPVQSLTCQFIIPAGPPRLVKVSGNGTLTSSATAGTAISLNLAVATPGGVFGGVGSAQGKVAVASDGGNASCFGVTQLAAGTYVAELTIQQGAAGTVTLGGSLFLSELIVELE